jgi:hypothetical protein
MKGRSLSVIGIAPSILHQSKIQPVPVEVPFVNTAAFQKIDSETNHTARPNQPV